jgi:hypothetical protein
MELLQTSVERSSDERHRVDKPDTILKSSNQRKSTRRSTYNDEIGEMWNTTSTSKYLFFLTFNHTILIDVYH